MAGIYIHIPFCKQACHYCNFHFATSLQYKDDMIRALVSEIELRKNELTTVSTIYFGGGTPSILQTDEIALILETLNKSFLIDPDAEITLEANPDDITIEKLQSWKNAGINRLSLGIQSFFEDDLVWMNRAHNAKQAVDSIELALSFFPNLTADLIYGTPGLTNEKWRSNVSRLLSLNVPHLSCYALTVETKTPLHKMIREQRSADIDPALQSHQFLLLMEWLKEAGFEHYEISNFAKPGFRSRHNSSYWQGVSYIGIGPSAHSYDGRCRSWNVSNNAQYIQAIAGGKLPVESELLTPTQVANEYLMTSLRTLEGTDLNRFNENQKKIILNTAEKYFSRGMMIREENMIRLTNEGKLLADGIAADLFF